MNANRFAQLEDDVGSAFDWQLCRVRVDRDVRPAIGRHHGLQPRRDHARDRDADISQQALSEPDFRRGDVMAEEAERDTDRGDPDQPVEFDGQNRYLRRVHGISM